MLFDLRGQGRRTTVKVVYVTLAILMGGGLVFFGIGGDVNGGLFDAISGSSSGNSQDTDTFEKRAAAAQRKAAANPQDAAAWAEAVRAQYQLARASGYVDAWREAHPDPRAEPGYTFPVWNPHVRLDYVVVPVAYVERIRSCEVMRLPSVVNRVSDHFPMVVELAGS